MIDWKKIDKDNLPDIEDECLVTNGRNVEVAQIGTWFNGERYIGFQDMSSVDREDMTHYAEINLPETE